MKIYTKTGDSGQTSLLGGSRVSKGDLRIEAYGTVDELNAWLGLLADAPVNAGRIESLRKIQHTLFDIGSHLAAESNKTHSFLPAFEATEISFLEDEIDREEIGLEPLRSFILPGGNPVVSHAHLARTVCRRAERVCIRLSEVDQVNPLIIKYLNRLSDYFFILARKISKESGSAEILWQARKK